MLRSNVAKRTNHWNQFQRCASQPRDTNPKPDVRTSKLKEQLMLLIGHPQILSNTLRANYKCTAILLQSVRFNMKQHVDSLLTESLSVESSKLLTDRRFICNHRNWFCVSNTESDRSAVTLGRCINSWNRK